MDPFARMKRNHRLSNSRKHQPQAVKESLAASVNGITRDLNLPINEDAQVQLLKWDEPEAKHAFWHTLLTCWLPPCKNCIRASSSV